MNLTDLFNMIKGAISTEESAAKGEAVIMALPAFDNDVQYIAGTSNELYNCHSPEDLGIWSGILDDF